MTANKKTAAAISFLIALLLIISTLLVPQAAYASEISDAIKGLKTKASVDLKSLDWQVPTGTASSYVKYHVFNDIPAGFFRYHKNLHDITVYKTSPTSTKDKITRATQGALETQKEFTAKTTSLLNKTYSGTSVEKIKKIHNYLLGLGTYRASKSRDTTAYGLTQGYANCQGYAKAFKYLCNKNDITCRVLFGTSKKMKGSHAWNAVKLGDTWYVVDVCWDDNLNDQKKTDKKYKFFLVSDAHHKSYVPECTSIRCPKDYANRDFDLNSLDDDDIDESYLPTGLEG